MHSAHFLNVLFISSGLKRMSRRSIRINIAYQNTPNQRESFVCVRISPTSMAYWPLLCDKIRLISPTILGKDSLGSFVFFVPGFCPCVRHHFRRFNGQRDRSACLVVCCKSLFSHHGRFSSTIVHCFFPAVFSSWSTVVFTLSFSPSVENEIYFGSDRARSAMKATHNER